MGMESIKAEEVLQLARNFRLRAAEAEDAVYYSMMLRTACELELQAEMLSRRPGGELVMIDDGEDDELDDA